MIASTRARPARCRVIIVHDDEKMAHGEACTSCYRFDAAKGPQEEIVSFHCKPEAKPVAQQTTFT